MTNTEFYVGMTINGKLVPSSAAANGTRKQCEKVSNRLNRLKGHPTVKYVVVPCD